MPFRGLAAGTAGACGALVPRNPLLPALSALPAVLLLSAASCAIEPDGPVAALAPALGAADSLDGSDRRCQVVLRSAARISDGAGGFVSKGSSWVFAGELHVASAALEVGAEPFVLYHGGSGTGWWEVAAEPTGEVEGAFESFRFRLDEHLPGPGMSGTALSQARIEVVPFLRLPGGGRLFDHNRNPGALDNYRLGWMLNQFRVADDPSACPARLAPGWVGSAVVRLTRDSGDDCAGGGSLAAGFVFDTWARDRATVTNVCFEVWLKGVTDWNNPDLWRQLDVQARHRTGDGPFAASYARLVRRTGNNALYAWDLRSIDPFRPHVCPDGPTTVSGEMEQSALELYFTVNGVDLRPAGAGAFTGVYEDHAANPWREAHCP
jgi:hypothetical protein